MVSPVQVGRDGVEPSFDVLGGWGADWTAESALDLLPENAGPRVEVSRGCVVVTPGGGYDRRAAQCELAYRLRQAARSVGLWAYRSVNLVSGNDLFIPDISVTRVPGGGRRAMDLSAAVLLGESGVPGVIDRPREYAVAGVPFFLRVDLRNRVPTIALFELYEGEYRPVSAAAAGTTFTMTEPFAFAVDPADLLDEEAPEELTDTDD